MLELVEFQNRGAVDCYCYAGDGNASVADARFPLQSKHAIL